MPPGLTLFLALFAAQAGIVVLSPILPDLAADLGVSTSTAGQLRAISGIVAGLTALCMGPIGRRVGIRDLLLVGLALMGLGSAASAAAPSFGVLAAAQVPVGAGVAILLTGGLAASGEWPTPENRSRLLSWALIGQPSAWVIGLPIIGLVAEWSWRYAWLAVPLAVSALAFLAARTRPADPPTRASAGGWRHAWREHAISAWAVGELLAYAGWAGTLVFSGALLVGSYGISTSTTGLVLGLAAAMYLPGNFLARRYVDTRSRVMLISLALVAAGGVVVFGTVRPALWVSVAVLTGLAFVAGGRTMAGSAYGLDAAPQHKVVVMSVRAAAVQFGYLLGAGLGGIALAAGGFPAMSVVLGSMSALAAVPLLLGARWPMGPGWHNARGRARAGAM